LKKIVAVQNAVPVEVKGAQVRPRRDFVPKVNKEQKKIHDETGPHALVYVGGLGFVSWCVFLFVYRVNPKCFIARVKARFSLAVIGAMFWRSLPLRAMCNFASSTSAFF